MRTATKSNPHLLQREKARTRAMKTQSTQKEKKKQHSQGNTTQLLSYHYVDQKPDENQSVKGQPSFWRLWEGV